MVPELEAARALAPIIAAAAEEIEARRELTPAVVEGLIEAGMFRLLVPQSLGGRELDLPTHVRVMEELAKADASTAWCVNQAAGLCFIAAYVNEAGRREIWADPRAVVANGQGPDNRAIPAPGGYRVTGRWAFSSGCRHATWLSGISVLHRDGTAIQRRDGTNETRSMLFPVGEAELIDTWQVGGLRGTGSHTFAVADFFVPEEYAVSLHDDPVREPGPLYLFPQISVFISGFGMTALGNARAAIDALIELAGGKRPRGFTQLLRDTPMVQAQVGQAEAHFRAGRALLLETVDEVWDQVCREHRLTLEGRVRIRLAGTHAIHEAARAVDLVYATAGASAIYASHPLQRRFQDAHTITQHVQGRLAHYETAGKHFLGLDPDPQWL